MCAKCRHVFVLRADFEQFYAFVPPAACPNPHGCNSCKFSCLSGGSEPTACRDYQEIKLQEQVRGNGGFFVPSRCSMNNFNRHPNHRCRGCPWAAFLVLWLWFWRMTWWTAASQVGSQHFFFFQYRINEHIDCQNVKKTALRNLQEMM